MVCAVAAQVVRLVSATRIEDMNDRAVPLSSLVHPDRWMGGLHGCVGDAGRREHPLHSFEDNARLSERGGDGDLAARAAHEDSARHVRCARVRLAPSPTAGEDPKARVGFQVVPLPPMRHPPCLPETTEE
ncbi:MAG: hypothetical protein KatS3mg015_1520 [Fimbriimonadales bacterium]|nr:MAG: hypothetical protein KatS3mg015_1520 [Fimbriimonadales bacterium]